MVDNIHSFARARASAMRKQLTLEEVARLRRSWFSTAEGTDIRDVYKAYHRSEEFLHLALPIRARYERLVREARSLKGAGEVNTRWNVNEVVELASQSGAHVAGVTDYHDPYFGRGMCAVVFATGMEYERFKTAPSLDAYKLVWERYCDAMEVGNRFSQRMLGRGIFCEPVPPVSFFGGTCLEFNLMPLAVKAGLGIIGKHYCLVTKQYGPRVRIGAAILYPSKDWEATRPRVDPATFADLDAICRRCTACIKLCPAGALENDDIIGCARQFANNYACGICLKVCPVGKIDLSSQRARTARALHRGAKICATDGQGGE